MQMIMVVLMVAAQGFTASTGAADSVADLLLYGGDQRDVFLGCLSCSETHRDSVHNRFGQYGNPFSGKSLLNNFVIYRNPVSPLSACNALALQPPIIVGRDGRFYGELTTNEVRSKRTTIKPALRWLALLCADKLD